MGKRQTHKKTPQTRAKRPALPQVTNKQTRTKAQQTQDRKT